MTEPDEDGTTFLISDIEHLCKQVVKAALPKYRWQMWDECTRMIRAMAEASLEFPWDSAESVTGISARRAQEVLRALVGAVPDPGERARLARVATREAERLEARMEAAASAPGIPASALCQACGKALPAGCKASRRTCDDNCRQKLRRMRVTAKARQP